MEKNTIGSFIAALRKANGITQKQLAELLGVTDKTISRWERDETAPDLASIPAMAEIFGITSDELLRGQRNRAGENAPDADKPKPEVQHMKRERQLQRLLSRTKSKYQIRTAISAGLALMGFVVSFLFRFSLRRYDLEALGFCIAMVLFLASGFGQAIYVFSAYGELDSDEFDSRQLAVLRDWVADTALNLVAGLWVLIITACLTMNTSLGAGEVLLLGGFFGILILGAYATLKWLVLIPYYARKNGVFRLQLENEALQDLRKETLMWAVWASGIGVFFALLWGMEYMLIIGMSVCTLAIVISAAVYCIRKQKIA